MDNKNIVLGNIYRIRQWDDMVKQYGMYEGNIDCEGFNYFTPDMKYLCGTLYIPIDIICECAGCDVLLPGIKEFRITSSMLEEL
jgi:hypothetical protein